MKQLATASKQGSTTRTAGSGHATLADAGEFDPDVVVKALGKGDLAGAITGLGTDPAKGWKLLSSKADALETLQGLMNVGRNGLSADQKAVFGDLFDAAGSAADKRTLFKVTFGVMVLRSAEKILSSKRIDDDTKGKGEALSDQELDIIFHEFLAVPMAHVANRSVRASGSDQSQYINGQVVMGNYEAYEQVHANKKETFEKLDLDSAEELYAKTVRHEIGHAMDEALNAGENVQKSSGWRIFQPSQVDDFIRLIDGYNGAERLENRYTMKDENNALREAKADAEKRNKTYEGKAPLDDRALAAKFFKDNKVGADELALQAKYKGLARRVLGKVLASGAPGVSGPLDAELDKAEEESEGFKDWFTDTNISRVLEGSRATTDSSQRMRVAGRMVWVNSLHRDAYFLDPKATSQLDGWGNNAAAVTDKEWVAELYAEWYRLEANPGSSSLAQSFPAPVKTWLSGPVAKYKG